MKFVGRGVPDSRTVGGKTLTRQRFGRPRGADGCGRSPRPAKTATSAVAAGLRAARGEAATAAPAARKTPPPPFPAGYRPVFTAFGRFCGRAMGENRKADRAFDRFRLDPGPSKNGETGENGREPARPRTGLVPTTRGIRSRPAQASTGPSAACGDPWLAAARRISSVRARSRPPDRSPERCPSGPRRACRRPDDGCREVSLYAAWIYSAAARLRLIDGEAA